MFEKAMSNQSTSPNWIIITAIDNQTKIEKEIICEATDLGFALFLDSNNTLQVDQIISSNFKINFKTQKALEQLRFHEYDIEKYNQANDAISSQTIDLIRFEHRKNERKLLDSLSVMYPRYFEKILFENRILAYRDCESGFTVIEKIYE